MLMTKAHRMAILTYLFKEVHAAAALIRASSDFGACQTG